ncbi:MULTISPECIES: LysR family transcriptional regulator [Sorangium]|uniref:LysR family transcriptional regulator n=1 Tax=Sorangium cellulosum TaxID=56 RepID=A0A4P2QWQ1_SORCE|nr:MULTISPECIES: LysR family transcriptional regulator [Sorangium]AUX34899.1 LysR family transcriptional regulator [Sorangium cellulosum]WCQ94205.1 HTH-type transcriptional regulator PgrR [Sorangium sp. Soce836]
MRGREFADLTAFAAIVEHGSFARAAAHLRVSPSALSQTIRGLEERLGVRLLNRTTRSVAPSEAGARLLSRLSPALTELDAAVADVKALRDRPAGVLRINTARAAAVWCLAPLLGPFHEEHPEIALDVVVEDAIADIVARRFDAGVRLGERLERDMVAVKLSGDLSMMAVASPAYLARHGVPATPRDLHRHRCINMRWPTDGSLYRWEFEKGKQSLEVAVEGPLTVNDVDLALRAAADGVGIAYVFDQQARPLVEAGKLTRVLEPWSPSFPGFYLYYPSRRQTPPALRAFVDFLRRAGPPEKKARRARPAVGAKNRD